jgi:hypothetical protein
MDRQSGSARGIGESMAMKMKRLTALLCAGAICVGGATAANAYTYHLYNCSGHTVYHVWMHTVSIFCHDVDWHGSVAPNATLTLDTASICLVDALEVDGSRVWSSSVGIPSATFSCHNGQYLPNPFKARHKAH